MKLRSTLIILGICALMLISGVVIWATHDEAPLDYSSMDIEIGPKDASINGYTRLQEIADEYDFSAISGLNVNPFVAYPALPQVELAARLQEYEPTIQLIDDAFGRELFLYDQKVNLQTVFTETKTMTLYNFAVCLKSRQQAIDGDPDAALKTLQDQLAKIERLSQAGGGIFNTIISAGMLNFTSQEIQYLISNYPLSRESLSEFLKNYPEHGRLLAAAANSATYEFQLAKGAFTDLTQDPASIYDTASSEKTALKPLASALYKPNATINWAYQIFLEHQQQLSLPLKDHEYPAMERLQQLADKKSQDTLTKYLDSNITGHIALLLCIPTLDGATRNLYKIELVSRVTYLLAALRLYQMDHQSLPTKLSDLVPAYIPSIPADPFDGQPIRYDAERAVLYSVGIDFIDNGGNSYPSRLDDPDSQAKSKFIAERYQEEPTYHIRFDLEPRTFERAE
ncbi:hypothetical protein [Cerasicoccus maritimus]|uniref:hypothetical protein n=1 Tax=Cerasicoccus maritimus TaxID=490089 RepID=UPI0028528831|nr:hypothetical protein [Cerasicoccus maritimus]